ncbi:ATP-NAD kinase [Pseudomonas aeruginosa]|nr:ATP-NAD kinase [Pseudomonas aeruginosa]
MPSVRGAAGELARRLVEGGLVRLASGEVRDLDEEALRAGRVAARWYGEMTVPEEGHFMQHVKQAGMESEELVLVDLADWLAENWEDGVRYVLGPGSTLHGLARNLGLETTLLGVDVLENGAVIARDVDEARLFELVDGHPAYLLVTAIGGQGHVIGRGNQQISPRVLRAIGLERMRVVATKRKLGTLGGRPLLVDSGDPVLDDSFPDAHPGLGRLQGRTAVSAGIPRRTRTRPRALGGKGCTRTYPARCAACCCSPCSDCRWWRPLRSNRSDWWMRRVPRWA